MVSENKSHVTRALCPSPVGERKHKAGGLDPQMLLEGPAQLQAKSGSHAGPRCLDGKAGE